MRQLEPGWWGIEPICSNLTGLNFILRVNHPWNHTDKIRFLGYTVSSLSIMPLNLTLLLDVGDTIKSPALLSFLSEDTCYSLSCGCDYSKTNPLHHFHCLLVFWAIVLRFTTCWGSRGWNKWGFKPGLVVYKASALPAVLLLQALHHSSFRTDLFEVVELIK